MRSVKSVTELKQLALQTGATVELGGKRFNTTGDRVKPETRPAPKPTPAPAPVQPAPAPVVQVAAPEVTVDLQPVADAQRSIGTMLAQALVAARAEQPLVVREWLFTVERDQNGLLTSIRATAQG